MPAARKAAAKRAVKIAGQPSMRPMGATRYRSPTARPPRTIKRETPEEADRRHGADEGVDRLDGRVEGHEHDREHDQRVEEQVRQSPLLEVGGRQARSSAPSSTR